MFGMVLGLAVLVRLLCLLAFDGPPTGSYGYLQAPAANTTVLGDFVGYVELLRAIRWVGSNDLVPLLQQVVGLASVVLLYQLQVRWGVWRAVAALGDTSGDGRGQGAARADPFDNGFHLVVGQAPQGDGGEIGRPRPRRMEVGPSIDEHHDA